MAEPVMGWAFCGVGALMIGIAGALARRPMRLVRSGGSAEGTVVGNEESVATGGRGAPRTYHHPIVAFATAKGEKVRFASGVGRRTALPKGSAVRVVFDPERPEDAEIASFARLWLMPVVAAILGLPFLAAGIAALG